MKVYLFSGLGANEKVFSRLKFPDGVETIFVPWELPEKSESINDYALRLGEKIDSSEDFVLVGLSFGGVIIQELLSQYSPKFIILISSIKDRNQMPNWMKLVAKSRVYRIIPTWFFTHETFLSYSFFRKLYDPRMPNLMDFFSMRDGVYLRWAIHEMLNWKNQNTAERVFHIHGTKDPVFPIKRIQNSFEIEKGNHLMVYTKADKVSTIIKKIFSENTELEIKK